LLSDTKLFDSIELDQASNAKLVEISEKRPLISSIFNDSININVTGKLISTQFKSELELLGEKNYSNTINLNINIARPKGIIPWMLAYPLILLLIITIYQFFSVIKKRKFIGDISFYTPKGFQGSFKNIDCNLSNISSAIIGENASDSSYGKAIDVKNNLGANTQFTMKAKKKFFGPLVIEIKSLSGFALDVISVEKKIRIVSPGTNSKSIKPGSVWRVNNVEVTMPRVR